jgi:NADH dehydrogenase [ubiquinone] 1 alpha subcomplex assembly factor 7
MDKQDNLTPLAEEMMAMIRAHGPMGVDQFMALALGHPRHGYYMTKNPFGVKGDFVTAPEISQMFGELLGLFAALVWQMAGSPGRIALVELGPGRGTLMQDALRAAKALPGFVAALEVHFVESSPALARIQSQTLEGSGHEPHWHPDISTLPEDCPLIILANEFFDALPVRQFHRLSGRWVERLVGLHAETGELAFGLAGDAVEGLKIDAPEGVIFETSPIALDIMRDLSERLVAQGGVLLAVDYGHARPGFGETVQAVRAHRFVPVLDTPGEADVTAHVDFTALGLAAKRGGAKVYPILTQATLLERLGIAERARILTRSAGGDEAAIREIALALKRLTGREEPGMGTLFKAMAISHPALTPPCFEEPDGALA